MSIAGKIEHTLLKADATEKEIVNLCHEAKMNRFAAVCVNPCYVRIAAKVLHGTGIGVVAVIGFPLGATLTEIKVQEVFAVKAFGAKEVDMVMNVGWAKSGNWGAVEQDIERVVKAAHACGLIIKVIIETSLLTEAEKKCAAEIVTRAGADFIKTSSGYASGGATVEDILNLKAWTGEGVRIKASGGIKTRESALQLIKAGADRLGSSSGLSLINNAQCTIHNS
ncbi:MAG TPA: deoxyribose-phosphate aldolase [Desulfitobacteriaceae bacterium]|nr:deoxyribose-phosphate aldolase [Desulfitobacteriaceae bacterium]